MYVCMYVCRYLCMYLYMCVYYVCRLACDYIYGQFGHIQCNKLLLKSAVLALPLILVCIISMLCGMCIELYTVKLLYTWSGHHRRQS